MALTDRDALGDWFLPASTGIRPTPGHRFSFAGKDGERIDCAVLTAEPNRRLAYRWQREGDSAPSTVEWTLEPVEGGTRLDLRHDAPNLPTSGLLRLNASLRALAAGQMARNAALHFRRRGRRSLRGSFAAARFSREVLLCL